MADDKQGRDEETNDEQRRQPERKREDVRDRAGEDRAMGGDPGDRLGDLDDALETEEYPTATDELVEAYGDYEIEMQGGWTPRRSARTDNQTCDSPTTFEAGYED